MPAGEVEAREPDERESRAAFAALLEVCSRLRFERHHIADQLDTVRDYPRGPIVQSGSLTLGNFGTVVGARNESGPTGGSRVLRGLMDEIQVFNRVLSLTEIQEAQRAPVPVVVDESRLGVVPSAAGAVELSWEAAGTFQLEVRDNVASGDWRNVTVEPVVDGNRRTVTLPSEAAAQFYRLRNRKSDWVRRTRRTR